MVRNSFELSNAISRNPLIRLSEAVNISIGNEEQIAVVGPNGSGKSLFIGMLTGQYPLKDGTIKYDFYPSTSDRVSDNVKYIAFRDSYGPADSHYYYQQRWNSQDADTAPEVNEMLGRINDETLKENLFKLFDIEPMLHKKIISLSSGELRKFQLTKALLSSPRVLIMDNPFIGLDAPTRELLLDLLKKIAASHKVQFIIVLSMMDNIPEFITHVITVHDKKVEHKVTREEYLQNFLTSDKTDDYSPLQQRVIDLPYSNINYDSDEVVRLNKVSIRYGERTILKELDWTVRRGEKWALSGANGSGKSTLLSLVCADNPQSYACDITLFGRKRGTGESIWEIKKHIGYVSPEMHRAYLKNLPTIEIVASGLHDSIGLYKRPHKEQYAICEWWMDIFNIEQYKDTPFLQLSSGEQRLALLARAFVKDPELLILDEPLHGLDTYNRRRVKKIIEAFCQRKDKTMIMVTHYENELPSTIDHQIYLKKEK
jgi:molybdate transport system ATP-binding protein